MTGIQWQVLALRITFWLIAEIALTLVGLDELADFSEFLSGERSLARTDRSVLCASVPS